LLFLCPFLYRQRLQGRWTVHCAPSHVLGRHLCQYLCRRKSLWERYVGNPKKKPRKRKNDLVRSKIMAGMYFHFLTTLSCFFHHTNTHTHSNTLRLLQDQFPCLPLRTKGSNQRRGPLHWKDSQET